MNADAIRTGRLALIPDHGRTPLKMIDRDSDSLALMEVGDRVRFVPISREHYLDLGGCFDEL